MKVYFATSNPAKVKLANERLKNCAVVIEQADLQLLEVQGPDVATVAIAKIHQAKTKLRKPLIVEDAGLRVNALNGFPGVLLKPVFETLGEKKFVKLLDWSKDRRAEVVGALAFWEPRSGRLHLFQGRYPGKISITPRGSQRRGWLLSRVFIPKGSEKTLAELTDREWLEFLDAFRQDDHFHKFSLWLKKQVNSPKK